MNKYNFYYLEFILIFIIYSFKLSLYLGVMSFLDKFNTIRQKGFKNRYFIVRHGQSQANVTGTVSSTPALSIPIHGLTDLGKEQAIAAASKLETMISSSYHDEDQNSIQGEQKISIDLNNSQSINENLLFYASDFKRTYETSFYLRKTFCHKFNLSSDEPYPRFITTPLIRERYYGQYDGQVGVRDLAQEVYISDSTQPYDFSLNGIESIESIAKRVVALIIELEDIWSGKTIVLVSHKDVCTVALALFYGYDNLGNHYLLPNFFNCDVRELALSPPKQ